MGLTLDYGPYQFLDQYDPTYICNKSDETGRYSFEKQPDIGFWNCVRLATALVPLVKQETNDDQVQQKLLDVLKKYPDYFDSYYTDEMLEKLGLYKKMDSDMTEIVYPLLNVLKELKVDYTLFFRYISSSSGTSFGDTFLERISNPLFTEWNLKFQKRLENEGMDPKERSQKMLARNPLIIPRNHHLLHVIKEANTGNYTPLEEYWEALQEPFSSKWDKSVWAQEPSPENIGLKCSCSS